MDMSLAVAIAGLLIPLIGTVVGGWAIVRRQADRTEKAVDEQGKATAAAIEALSSRMDAKFEKHIAALTSVQEVSGESMRRVLAAWARIEDESKLAAHEREERARLQEQMSFQRDLITELKRTQELNLADVRRAIAEHKA